MTFTGSQLVIIVTLVIQMVMVVYGYGRLTQQVANITQRISEFVNMANGHEGRIAALEVRVGILESETARGRDPSRG